MNEDKHANSVKRIAWFLKQQIEFLLISCLVVSKSFIKKVQTIFKTFLYIWTSKCFYCCYRLYICVKSFVIFYVEFKKKIILFSLFSPQFFIQKLISVLNVKWTGMDKERAGPKSEVLSEHIFCMTLKSFWSNWDLYFNV